MKRGLFGVLLILAVTLCLVLPGVHAQAETVAEVPSIEITSDLRVDAVWAECRQDEDGHVYYCYDPWHAVFDVIIDNVEIPNMTIQRLQDGYGFTCGYGMDDVQSYDHQLAVGDSVPMTLDLYNSQGQLVLHQALNMVIVPAGSTAKEQLDITISGPIVLDELMAEEYVIHEYDPETGAEIEVRSYSYYWIDSPVPMTISGETHTDKRLSYIVECLFKNYPDAKLWYQFADTQLHTAPWEAGKSYKTYFRVCDELDKLLYGAEITVQIEPTKIEKITGTISYMQSSANAWHVPTFTITYKDGSTEVMSEDDAAKFMNDVEWPTEVGEHVIYVRLSNYKLEIPVTVTVQEPPIKILSPFRVDVLSGFHQGDYISYDWSYTGRFDAEILGKRYENITQLDMSAIMEKAGYSYVYFGWSMKDDADWETFESSAENPWIVGTTRECILDFYSKDSGESIGSQEITIVVEESDIVSVTAKPVTGYLFTLPRIEFTATYKDGSTAPLPEGYSYSAVNIPEEAGTHNTTVLIGGILEVPITITILPTPTSGSMGKTATWKFDESTVTLTISGNGEAVLDFDGADSIWHELLAQLQPKHIVVEEGITKLPDLIFAMCPYAETLKLPSTLKSIPTLLLGQNGPVFEPHLGVTTLVIPENITSWTNLAFYYAHGLTNIYIPDSITELNPLNLIYGNALLDMSEMDMITVHIHFQGTEAQWNAIKHAVADDEYTQGFDLGLTKEETQKYLDALVITFNDPADCYTPDAVTVPVPDTSVEITKGEDVVIDVTQTEEKVGGIILDAETVDKIADAETSVEIKLSDVTVSFDQTAVSSIGQQAGNAAVTIVAKEVTKSTLNTQQTTALKQKEVEVVLSLEAYAGSDKITNFGSGVVTVSVPFEVPEGKKGGDYYVAYVADDGTVTAIPTSYEDGKLTFQTTHFSHYVVLALPTGSNIPNAGDFSAVALALLFMSGACLVTISRKKRA